MKGEKPMQKRVSTILIIGIAVNSAIFTALVYAHSNFITIREKEDIIRRLDRIENKLDKVIGNSQRISDSKSNIRVSSFKKDLLLEN